MGVIVDPAVLPGLLLLAAELAVLAAVGFVVVRVALGQDDELSALAQGLVVGPALWGLIVNFIMYAVPGMAGAAVGWAVTLILGAALAWRSPGRLRPPARMVVGFAGAVLVLGWAALASRQLLQVSDPYITLGLAASIRAGGFPVALPWHPDTPAAYHSYHYGANLLTGLLAPPTGPDLAFVWELLGVYAWVSFALVVVTALRRRGSWLTALALVPLLLGYGLHTFVWDNPSEIAGILRLPVPAGLPAAGLRASLADIYWSPLESVGSPLGSLPDVWKPAFPLGYAVAFVVLEQAARAKRPAWLGSLTLAGLVGFLGLLVTTLTPVVVVLWAGLDALRLARARRAGTPTLMLALQSGAGLAVAGLLLRFGGGALTGLLGGGAGSSGLAWAGSLDASHWQILGAFHARPGGVGLLSLGPPGGRGRRCRAGAARPAGADAGDRRRPAGPDLAGARLSAGPPGPEPPGGARPQLGARRAAAGAQRAPRQPAVQTLELCCVRAARGPDRLAHRSRARTQPGRRARLRRSACQRRVGAAGSVRAGRGGGVPPVSAAGHVQPLGRLSPRPHRRGCARA